MPLSPRQLINVVKHSQFFALKCRYFEVLCIGMYVYPIYLDWIKSEYYNCHLNVFSAAAKHFMLISTVSVSNW